MQQQYEQPSNARALAGGVGEIPPRLSDEVYTPPALFEKLGITFDLDVCAPPGGLPWIPAKHHYSITDDGLAQPWYGNVWMNPPYSSSGVWIRKFIQHNNGIAIVPFARSKPMLELWASNATICYPYDPRKPTTMMTFIKNNKRHSIFMPVIVAAFGKTNCNALHNIGRVR